MGTIVSYNVTYNWALGTLLDYDIVIFDNDCLSDINQRLDKQFELDKTYTISIEEMQQIRTVLLRNYSGLWTE